MPVKYFFIEKRVNKRISKLPLYLHAKIDKAFDRLKENPMIGARLKGELGDAYKYRIGDYRIVYKFNVRSKTLTVVKIEHRQGVYR